MAFKIYISCPISVDQSILNKYIRASTELSPENTQTHYWVRGTTYTLDNTVNTCDAFILILPNNRYEQQIGALPVGCKKELIQAIDHHRSLYIGYMNSTGLVHFYLANVRNGVISGVTGSSGELKRKIESSKYTIELPEVDGFVREVIVPPTIEKRLLLLLL